jgi:Family of unknown function (DUF5372)
LYVFALIAHLDYTASLPALSDGLSHSGYGQDPELLSATVLQGLWRTFDELSTDLAQDSQPQQVKASASIHLSFDDLPLDHSGKPTTIPNPSDEALEFTVTHPFHPLKGQTYAILSRRSAWGEPRVQFLDPVTEQVRSLPIAWTSLATPDSFIQMAAGQALLRLVDLQRLSTRLHEFVEPSIEDGTADNRLNDPQ